MGLFGGKKKNEYDGDGVVAIIPPLSPPRVPVDDGEGGLMLGFRDDKAREAALKECTLGVVDRCVQGAAGGCALSAARECERTVPPRPKNNLNPLSFVAGAFRSKEDRARELEEREKAHREAREACEAEKRERCNAEAREVCKGHAGAFCAAVLRGRGKFKLGKGGEVIEEEEDMESNEEEDEEEEEEGIKEPKQQKVSDKDKVKR